MRVRMDLLARLAAAWDGLCGRAAARAPQPAASGLELLALHAPDLITRHAPDGRIRFASAAGARLLGHAALEGMTPAELVHPEDRAALQAVFRDASYFGREGGAVVRLLHADGRPVWVELRCRRMAMAEGGDIVAVTREISAFKAQSAALAAQSAALAEARDAALAATQEKSRFLAAMSHELRTPLNAIIGFSEVMARQMFGPLSARYQEYAGLIQDSGQHLLDLINGLLDMSKIEAGKFEIHEELFELEPVVESAARLVALAAERTGVTVRVTVEQEARRIFADRRAVKQMLVNLLSNAVKFTLPGGDVALVARVEGRAVMLSVSDTGTGIAPEELERLGRPFAQARQARGKEGTGLGLALVKALADLHGGEAVIASVLGEGTTVTVRLPHAAVAAAKAEKTVVPFRGAA